MASVSASRSFAGSRPIWPATLRAKLRQLQRQEFVEIDGLEQPVVQCAQHFGRNERDAERALARLQVIDRGEGNGSSVHRPIQCLFRP